MPATDATPGIPEPSERDKAVDLTFDYQEIVAWRGELSAEATLIRLLAHERRLREAAEREYGLARRLAEFVKKFAADPEATKAEFAAYGVVDVPWLTELRSRIETETKEACAVIATGMVDSGCDDGDRDCENYVLGWNECIAALIDRIRQSIPTEDKPLEPEV